MIEKAEARGEPPDDALLLFSVLYGFWGANLVAFNGGTVRDLAAQFLSLAERQGATIPLLLGHRIMGYSLLMLGDFVQARKHFDEAIARYDQAEHGPLATRFGQDAGVSILSGRSWALWDLGYPEAALTDADHALKSARAIGDAATSIFALAHAQGTHSLRGSYSTAMVLVEELVALAGEKHALFWKQLGMLMKGSLLASTGKFSDAVELMTSGIKVYRETGAILNLPLYLSGLAIANAELGQFREAWRCIGEAINSMETAQQRITAAELNRIAGEIALKSPERDTAKAEMYFERALAESRQQQAKSWELRASMSLARLWRDQGKVSEARELLAPVYGWFTEGFDTCDLKEAKALLEELAS